MPLLLCPSGIRPSLIRTTLFTALLLPALGVLPSSSHPHELDDSGPTALRAVQATVETEGVALEFFLDGAVSYTVPLHLDNPPRLVVDLHGAVSELASHRMVIGTKELSRLRVGQHRDKVRLVLDGSAGALRDARLVRTERGVALIVGDVDLPQPRQLAGKSAAPVAPPQAARKRAQETAPPPQPARPRTAPPSPPRAQAMAPAPRPPTLESPGESSGSASSAAPPRMAAVSPRSIPAPDVPDGMVDPLTYAGVMDWLRRNQGARPSFRAGDIIGHGEIEKIRPFVPPGPFGKLNFPELALEIQETLDLAPHASYTQASLQYGGQTGLAPDGSITNYVSGQPFSEERILAASPQEGGLMAAWNNIYRWQFTGYRSDMIPMAYIAPGAGGDRNDMLNAALLGGGNVERHLVVAYQRVYLSHVASLADQGYAIKVRDAEKQHFKDWMEFSEPFDMRGVAFVFERFRDPREPDQVNSYLPTERRVRRLSAKERADSFAGSEMTMDDFEGFSGRILDYEWKYVGEKGVLAVHDSKHDHSRFYGPQSDVAWDRYQLRRCHVVESKPLYEGHPYGRKLTFYDAQTYNVISVIAFDRNDRLLKHFYTIYHFNGGSPSGDAQDTVVQWRSTVAQNFQNQRSTVNWGIDVENPKMKASKVRRLFSVSNLTGGR